MLRSVKRGEQALAVGYSARVTAEDSAAIKVLLVEDDERLAALTTQYLEGHGLVMSRSSTGPDALAQVASRQFDVVLLDLNLPGLDGLAVCRRIRERSAVPIIMVTARDELFDRVIGLDAGADDYVSKPFSARELLSRIHATVRRARGSVGPELGQLEVGRLRMVPERLAVYLDQQPVETTSHEFAILYALAKNAGRALSREQLLDLAKGNAEESFDRSVDVHISRLRSKLGDDARKPTLLKTIRGVGYLLSTS
ncbi:MAG: response regulator transcription factor [Sandaracinaceae bacterium]|nr:response regulator transcription factor [Sandaracinaceae bacterium]